ncbi:unnamed protein product, partial [Musa acuminata var. zebrina]
PPASSSPRLRNAPASRRQDEAKVPETRGGWRRTRRRTLRLRAWRAGSRSEDCSRRPIGLALGTGAANSASGSAYPAFGATTVIVSVFFDEPLLTLQRPELYFHNPLRTCTEQDNDNSTNRSLHISTIAQKAAAECMRWCGSSKKLKLKQKCELSLVLQSI